MTTALQAAGASSEPSSFAPLHINRFTTGLWTNSNPLRDAASAFYEEKFYGGKNDRLVDGLNCEISSRLTLRRRAGLSVYNHNVFPPVKRFYSWNTFTLTDENIRVLADTKNVVYEVTRKSDGTELNVNLWTKAAGAGDTYFLGVGNVLYFTNGVENKQIDNASGQVFPWGIDAPVNAPVVTQQPKPNPYPAWSAQTVYSPTGNFALTIEDSNFQYMQKVTTFGTTGTGLPSWANDPTPDGSVVWKRGRESGRPPNTVYQIGDAVVGSVVDSQGLNIATLFFCTKAGTTSSSATIAWTAGIGSVTGDGGVEWTNAGNLLQWPNIGPTTAIVGSDTIVDPNGYLQQVFQLGKTGTAPPQTWSRTIGGITTDGSMIWVNKGAFTAGGSAAQYYGYEYMNPTTEDLSGMSPKSVAVVLVKGSQIVVQGDGTGQAGVTKIVIFKTLKGGSTFGYAATIDNPGAGNTWTWVDNVADEDVNLEWQAQISGEGTPLPIGATCLEYHLGHIFAAVDNVVYVSSGPDAAVGGSSGNAGFDTTLTAQSKITRFWVNPLGVMVFTVRDVYLITGSGTDIDPFNMQRWITNLPLLSYDAFDVNLTTPYLFTGNRTLISMDPSAGLVEMSFPIADIVAYNFDPKLATVTYHTSMTGEAAWFLSDGSTRWHRLSPINAPDSGFNWNPRAEIQGGFSAVQSVEIQPGIRALLVGPPAGGGPIRQRDFTVNTDTGTPFDMFAMVGNIILAQPGQLAALAWITTESMKAGKAPAVSLLLNEVQGTYEPISRTHQDPPNLPPSTSLIANRHSVLQGQKPVWCRHFRMRLDWTAEDAANELLAYTVFGQIWQEMRST